MATAPSIDNINAIGVDNPHQLLHNGNPVQQETYTITNSTHHPSITGNTSPSYGAMAVFPQTEDSNNVVINDGEKPAGANAAVNIQRTSSISNSSIRGKSPSPTPSSSRSRSQERGASPNSSGKVTGHLAAQAFNLMVTLPHNM